MTGRRAASGGTVGFSRHRSGVRWGEEGPSPTSVERGTRVPSAHRRPDYPLSGCVPAEPDSVSPGGPTVTNSPTRNKSNGPKWDAPVRSVRCTPEPRWVRFARRCGSVLLADYHTNAARATRLRWRARARHTPVAANTSNRCVRRASPEPSPRPGWAEMLSAPRQKPRGPPAFRSLRVTSRRPRTETCASPRVAPAGLATADLSASLSERGWTDCHATKDPRKVSPLSRRKAVVGSG